MYILKSNSGDAYFNIALEEYILNNFEEDFFIIAVNEPSIIIGNNQNTYEEINALYVKQNSVKVVRRLSGGGAVFQDQGNLNFSSIYHNDGSSLIDFSKISELITGFLHDKFSLDTSFSGRNDLVIEDKKFSGQARHIHGNKILHHGTILLSSNKKSLTDALKFNPEKYSNRALRSNHERVTNIAEHISEPISMDKFKDLFVNYVRSQYPEAKVYELTHDDIVQINELVKTKYSTWDWNYGEKPDFKFSNTLYSKSGNLCLHFNIVDNKISAIRIYGDFFSQKNISEIENALIGIEHDTDSISRVLNSFETNLYLSGIDLESFVKCFFPN